MYLSSLDNHLQLTEHIDQQQSSKFGIAYMDTITPHNIQSFSYRSRDVPWGVMMPNITSSFPVTPLHQFNTTASRSA